MPSSKHERIVRRLIDEKNPQKDFGSIIVAPNVNGSWRIELLIDFDKLPRRTESEELNKFHNFTGPKEAMKKLLKELIKNGEDIVGFVATVLPEDPDLRAFLRCVGFNESGSRHTKCGTIHYFELKVKKWTESEKKKE